LGIAIESAAATVRSITRRGGKVKRRMRRAHHICGVDGGCKRHPFD
jgi:hypothetical protein